MKRWISVASHLFAFGTSFVALSVAPVVGYGAAALNHAWRTQSDIAGDPTSMLAVPLLSALGAALFSAIAAPLLCSFGQKASRRFNWGSTMFPALVACGATVGFSLANALLGWEWSSLSIIGAGLATSAALSAYWWPLGWAQNVLPRLDERAGQMRARLSSIRQPVRVSLP